MLTRLQTSLTQAGGQTGCVEHSWGCLAFPPAIGWDRGVPGSAAQWSAVQQQPRPEPLIGLWFPLMEHGTAKVAPGQIVTTLRCGYRSVALAAYDSSERLGGRRAVSNSCRLHHP